MHLQEAVSQLDAGTLSRDDFLAVLQTAELAVPLRQAAAGGSELCVFGYGSESCAAVFTDPTRVVIAYRQLPIAKLTGRQLAEQWSTELFLSLDPTEDGPGLMIPAAAVQRMASDYLSRVVPVGSKTVIGAPAIQPPVELSQLAAELVRSTQGIERAYLFQMGVGTEQPALVLGVVLAGDEDVERLMPAAAQWIATRQASRGPIDLLPLSGSLLETVAAYVPAITG